MRNKLPQNRIKRETNGARNMHVNMQSSINNKES